jgi:o-succinylbenzoate synthase
MRYSLSFRRYRLPFRTPMRTAHGLWAERDGAIIRLENESGRVGWGEAAPVPGFGGETVAEIAAACGELGAGVDDARLDAVPASRRCLRHALAMAREPHAPAVAHKYLGVAALLPAGRSALAQIADRAEAGFRVFKWKVGVGDVADELALFDDVCGALPGGAKLRLDANGAWDRRRAERWLERCADRSVEFVEQPCFADPAREPSLARRMDDLLLGLANDFPTPLAIDESLTGDGDVDRWLGLGWPGLYVVKPSLLADPVAALALLARSKAQVVFSSALETAVGAQVALRLALSWPGEGRALGFGVWPLFADSRFDGPAAAPFIGAEDVERIKPEDAWNALS